MAESCENSFTRNKEDEVIKEKSGTSDINQPYNQQQAVTDKRVTRQLLDIARSQMTQKMNVHKLVGIAVVAMKSLPE
eukprot:4932955-Ditylum_brightwellii.AAC.1